MPVMSEEEKKMREQFLMRMRLEQEMKEQRIKDDVERCPHGVPLSRSCRKCDVVTPDQIQDSVPIYHYKGDK